MGIEQRSKVVDERTRPGGLEAEFMMGKAYKSFLLVIIDRATLLARLKKVTSRQADPTEATFEEMVARVPKAFIKTLTHDNDKSFASHRSIGNKLDASVYFTRPYTSQNKGMVENRIGVVRQFFQRERIFVR